MTSSALPGPDAPTTPGMDAAATVRVEQAGLDALARALEDPAGLGGAFEQAVAMLLGISGRVVITGIGKSGHVARKIQSTLASTGTPSFTSTLPRPLTEIWA